MEKKVNKPDYVIVAEELNQIMGLKPQINVELPKVEVINQIVEAATLLDPLDELTELTTNYLEKMGFEFPEEEE